jgi:hypothetical protein
MIGRKHKLNCAHDYGDKKFNPSSHPATAARTRSTAPNSSVPHFNDENGDVSAQKMLYVVGSRARKNLHLFSETGRRRGR